VLPDLSFLGFALILFREDSPPKLHLFSLLDLMRIFLNEADVFSNDLTHPLADYIIKASSILSLE
jgi:hypothetical protein